MCQFPARANCRKDGRLFRRRSARRLPYRVAFSLQAAAREGVKHGFVQHGRQTQSCKVDRCYGGGMSDFSFLLDWQPAG